jgi:hypothetical protein
MVEYLLHKLKEVRAQTVLKYFSVTPPENSGGAENSTENSGPHARIFFGYMYELSQRHPVWVAEINVMACNSAGRGRRLKNSSSGNKGIFHKCP